MKTTSLELCSVKVLKSTIVRTISEQDSSVAAFPDLDLIAENLVFRLC